MSHLDKLKLACAQNLPKSSLGQGKAHGLQKSGTIVSHPSEARLADYGLQSVHNTLANDEEPDEEEGTTGASSNNDEQRLL